MPGESVKDGFPHFLEGQGTCGKPLWAVQAVFSNNGLFNSL